MDITFPDELYDNLNDQMDEVQTIVSDEKVLIREAERAEEKKNQIIEQKKNPKSNLTFPEKKRLGIISDNLFAGGKKKLEEVKKVNDFRNKMRDYGNLGAAEKVKEKKDELKNSSIDSFKKAIKLMMMAGGVFMAWRFGFFEKVNFRGLFDNVVYVCNRIGQNIIVLFDELPQRISKISSLVKKGLQNEETKDKVLQKAQESLQKHMVEMFEVLFPHFMREFSSWMEVANVIGNIVSMAFLGGQIGAYIGSVFFGVGSVPGAIIGAAIGAVIGVIQSAIEYYSKDNVRAEEAFHEISTIGKRREARERMINNVRGRLLELLNKQHIDSKRKDKQSFEIRYVHDGLSPEEKTEVVELLSQYSELADGMKDDMLFSYLSGDVNKGIDTAPIFKYFKTLGIDTSLFQYGEFAQKKYITGFNGVSFTAENPEPFVKEVKTYMEKMIAARLSGTTLEGKTPEEIYNLVNDFVTKPSSLNNDTKYAEAIRTLLRTIDESYVVDGKVSNAGIAALHDVSRSLEIFHIDRYKEIEDLTKKADNLKVFEEQQKEIIEQNKRNDFLSSYQTAMEDDAVEKVLADNALSKKITEMFESFLSNDGFISSLFFNMGVLFGKSVSVLTSHIQKPVIEDVSFVDSKDKMKNIITFFVSDKDYGRGVMRNLLNLFSEAIRNIDLFFAFFNKTDRKIQNVIDNLGVFVFGSKNKNGLVLNEDFTIKTVQPKSASLMLFEMRENYFLNIDNGIFQSEQAQEILDTFSSDDSAALKVGQLEKNTTSTGKIELKDNQVKDNQQSVDSSVDEISAAATAKIEKINLTETDTVRRLNPVYVHLHNQPVSVVSNDTSQFLSDYLTTQDALESNNGEGGYGVGHIIYS